jgi:hypothetical protein
MTTQSMPSLRSRLDSARAAIFPERLNCDTVDAKPLGVDWAAAFRTAEDPEDCRAVIAYPDGEELELEQIAAKLEEWGEDVPDEWTERDVTEEGELVHDPDDVAEALRDAFRDAAPDHAEEWEPMMDYAYPLGRGDCASVLQSRLLAAGVGCVVAVELDGQAVLALSGGGMDLSWDICHAYAVCGYMPPAHFCDLPAMSGRGESEQDLAILAVCLESLEVQAGWAQGRAGRLIALAGGESAR